MWKYWSEQLNFGGLESRKISVFFPSLPCSCLPYISASPRPCSSSLAHLLLPARLPACLPAGYLQTHSSFSVWQLSLEPVRTWDTHVAACQPICVFCITGVFIKYLLVCVCMSESTRRRVLSMLSTSLITEVYATCAYMSQDTSACVNVHTSVSPIDSRVQRLKSVWAYRSALEKRIKQSSSR